MKLKKFKEKYSKKGTIWIKYKQRETKVRGGNYIGYKLFRE